MPKISVLMSAFNAEKYIAEAIDSVLSQSFSDFEFSIVDDKGDFIENCPPEKLLNQNYACGCFHFIKQ